MPVDLLVTGTGSLAQAVLFDLMAIATAPLSVMVIGRRGDRLQWLSTAANARASAFGTAHRVAYRVVDWSAQGDLERAVEQSEPRLAFHAASLQSAWDLADPNDPWGRTVRAQGYAVTLPLQLDLAIRLAQALRSAAPRCRLVNACYPDATNEVLMRLGHDVLCGVGNIAILANVLAAQIAPDDNARLTLLAHHRQVACAIEGKLGTDAPRIWIDGDELAPAAVPDVRLPGDASLNLVTGATAARLLMAALGRLERHVCHAPGVLGLPGGYPIEWEAGALQLVLPPGVGIDEAVAWNRLAAHREGIMLDGDRVVLARREEGGATPLQASYDIRDIQAVAQRMLALKADLRGSSLERIGG